MPESTDNPAEDDVKTDAGLDYGTENTGPEFGGITYIDAEPEQSVRIAALHEAKGLLMRRGGAGPFMSGEEKTITDSRIFVQDVIELAEYIQSGVRVAELEYAEPELAQPHYPYADGDFYVLGPGIFHKIGDNSVINVSGVNYIPQPETETTNIPEEI